MLVDLFSKALWLDMMKRKSGGERSTPGYFETRLEVVGRVKCISSKLLRLPRRLGTRVSPRPQDAASREGDMGHRELLPSAIQVRNLVHTDQRGLKQPIDGLIIVQAVPLQ